MRRSRFPIVIVMIVALLLSAVTRDWARAMRASTVEGQPVGDAGAGNSLANMNSFALALLLGGLRDRIRDAVARQHAGDQELLSLEQHASPSRPGPDASRSGAWHERGVGRNALSVPGTRMRG